ncbi:hypothetical protein DV737_g1414, partial [Chaetothyriales sp. CBS 132003]
MAPSRADDDIVFTLSDDDDNSSISPSDLELPAKRKRQPTTKRNRPTKKRQKVAQAAVTESDRDDEDEGEGEAVRDENIDSDFEFEAGAANGFAEDDQDFDGWATAHSVSSTKKGVSIDDIIARRARRKAAHEEAEQPADEQSNESGSVVNGSITFDDDELTSGDEEAAKRQAFFATEDPAESIEKARSFQQFALSRPILRALGSLSFVTPTPIQARTIPVALQGLDVVGSAVTGSGKTAAFLLPILERLLYRPRKVPTTRVAILMPTRELAVQCHNVATALARFTDVTFAILVGGFSLREQEAVLKKRPDVVIATPGRFIDHMRNSPSFSVENIEILVLDEADRMLETGFEDELDEILKTIPKSRQTMLFSATMTNSVDKLVRVGMNKPVRLSVDANKATTTGLVQEFVRLRPGREDMRLATLCLLCQDVFTDRAIVFFRQKKDAHRVRILLGLLGLKAGELHGSMSQGQRIQAVDAFRDGQYTHLLATDLASRGLDIKNVQSVVNYEAPQTHEIYVHRVGRTARAGRSGRSCTIAAEPDRKVVKAVVKSARQTGAKIAPRTLDAKTVDAMHEKIEALLPEIDEILAEEKEEKQLAQAEQELTKSENLVKHEAEIMSRPKRTWFETEKEKQEAKRKAVMELNGVKVKMQKTKLSNKDKKRLDARRERKEGKAGGLSKRALSIINQHYSSGIDQYSLNPSIDTSARTSIDTSAHTPIDTPIHPSIHPSIDMSVPDHKSFSAKLKESMTPWIFKKEDQKTAESDPAAADAASAPTDASPTDAPPTGEENPPDSGDPKKVETAVSKTGKVRGRLWHRKGEKKKE